MSTGQQTGMTRVIQDEVEAATAKLLINIAFLVPNRTDLTEALAPSLLDYKRAIEERVKERAKCHKCFDADKLLERLHDNLADRNNEIERLQRERYEATSRIARVIVVDHKGTNRDYVASVEHVWATPEGLVITVV